MPDDPIEAEFEVVKKLKGMSVQFRTDLARAHPMPQQTMSTVKETIRDQWNEEQKEGKSKGEKKEKGQSQGKDDEQLQDKKDKDKEQGPSSRHGC